MQITAPPETHPAVQELQAIDTFHDLPHDKLDWLASQMSVQDLEPGDSIIRPGSPADRMIVVLKGQIIAETLNRERTIVWDAGQITGTLPFSRLTTFPLTSKAVGPARVAWLMKDKFPEMLERMPVLTERLVALMADRIREVARIDQQSEKLAALGKLSAGLAHELNNPAAAAKRAAQGLREAIESVKQAYRRLEERGLTPDQRMTLAAVEREVTDRPTEGVLDPLDRSDREQSMAEWLAGRGVKYSSELPPNLVESGFDTSCMEEIASHFPVEALGDALTRATALVSVGRLLDEIDSATSRISELVRAVKEYSHMDQAVEQELDVHDGIETTLIMLKHKLKKGIAIKRDFDRSLPKVCLRGSEMNQVWTNLIVNAVEAMHGEGELRLHTARQNGWLLVEIGDTGPGIPDAIRDHVFEPFFTTKEVGEGTGLGLDMVRRIVRNHRGQVTFQSEPGNTRFQIRLPLPTEPQAVIH